RMVHDLEMGRLEIATAPIVREPDGLALSSRNAYLSAEERAQAVGLHRALEAARRTFAGGEADPAVLRSRMAAELARHPLLEPQYVELVDALTLTPVERADARTVAALAVFCGRTRLIDNVTLGEDAP